MQSVAGILFLKNTLEGEKVVETNQYEDNNSNRNQKLLNQLF
jgi:hypothetical protein